jgi:uncharacterized protein (DUF849 family)
MAQPRKVIITSAVTGAIHTPTMSPHLPITQDEIADAAIGAAEAGAAILHLHTRDPKDGRPSQEPEHFEPVLQKVSSNTDAVVNITTGGSPHMSVEERMQPVSTFKPELASLNMGSMNFGLFPMLDKYPSFQNDWEREHLENSRDLVFKNTFADIERILEIGNSNGTRFEFECYDISHLYNLAHFQGEAWRKARSSCSQCSVCSVASEDIRKISCICTVRLIVFLTTISGQFLGQGRTSSRWQPWVRLWDHISVWALKTHCGLVPANWLSRTQHR